MRIVENICATKLDSENLHLSIGNFDGIHIGHRAIIQRMVARARAASGVSALMTLRPHPAHIFSPSTAPKRIRSNAQMHSFLEKLGVDLLLVFPFTAENSMLSRDAFLRDIILGQCRAKELILGHDFAFGNKASGNLDYLRSHSEPLGYGVEEIPPVMLDGVRVSSSLIRRLLKEGNLQEAERCLGAPFAVRGIVQNGRGIGGASLGFPTANIDPSLYVLPPNGIYAAQASIFNSGDHSETYSAAVNLGIAPTYAHDKIMLEAHLLGFEGELSGKEIEVVFSKFIRPEKKFNAKEELIRAIENDIAEVRAFFA